MELNWTHHVDKNYLECIITENLYYRAFKGGKKIKKYVDEKVVDVFAFTEHDDLGNMRNFGLVHTIVIH